MGPLRKMGCELGVQGVTISVARADFELRVQQCGRRVALLYAGRRCIAPTAIRHGRRALDGGIFPSVNLILSDEHC